MAHAPFFWSLLSFFGGQFFSGGQRESRHVASPGLTRGITGKRPRPENCLIWSTSNRAQKMVVGMVVAELGRLAPFCEHF